MGFEHFYVYISAMHADYNVNTYNHIHDAYRVCLLLLAIIRAVVNKSLHVNYLHIQAVHTNVLGTAVVNNIYCLMNNNHLSTNSKHVRIHHRSIKAQQT